MTTHACPRCGDTALILLRSCTLPEYDRPGYKQCSACSTNIYWPLDEGQAPLVGSNRVAKRVPTE